MFGDELDVGYHAYSILKTGKDYTGHYLPLVFQSLAEKRTPLYLYSCVPTVAIFGISPLGVRLPAAIFGILGVWATFLFVSMISQNFGSDASYLGLTASFLLAINPWHIQYSRAGFEVTELLFFILIGLYFFFKSLENKGKGLWIATLSLSITFWIYNTSKLFIPLIIGFLVIAYFKDLISLQKKYLVLAILIFSVVSIPAAINTLYSGSASRFGYISIFSDQLLETKIGELRAIDTPNQILGKLFHNKFVIWTEAITTNYFESLSFNFLFDKGDLNRRQTIENMGLFYRVEAIALTTGVIVYFVKLNKTKLFIIFWILAGILPSALTTGGGYHATRLILILPPLILLISIGCLSLAKVQIKKISLISIYILILTINFLFYQHQYWIHDPYDNARWWHYGFNQVFNEVKKVEKEYDKIIITTSNEPPWIFFAGWYQYPPDKWQSNYPFKKVALKGFGQISYIDKFYFGSLNNIGVYGWGEYLDNKTLFIATAKDVNVNLIAEPERTPKDLKVVKAITYPSGDPAFYLITAVR
jgi:4-amino-4-deoxy-L-arabinose transferase-like glycosyltransferase